MKQSYKKRLNKLERCLKGNKKSKYATIVCDPDILQSFDTSTIEAECVLILPDNGHRTLNGEVLPKGSYIIHYS